MKHLYKSLAAILLSLFFLQSFSQPENRKWYFGSNAGLDFSTSPPTALSNGAMSTFKGCATICDASGNLLFYTNGVTIWNQNHVVMANGSGLSGNANTAQSCLIVKQPANPGMYFVFTLGAGGNSNLDYSVVNMSLAAGLGSVTVKNATVSLNNSERLAGVYHCNGQDVWVMSHDNNNTFRAYLVSSAGVNTTPTISATGIYNGYNGTSMKFSPNGKKLCSITSGTVNTWELFDFDRSTGLLTNSLSLATTSISPYGCEFSPDGSKLYATNGTNLVQWNLCAGSNSAIVSSIYTLAATASTPAPKGTMQLGNDGKIYVAAYLQNSLGVINNPNALGAACNYSDTGQSLAPSQSQVGLQNFVAGSGSQSSGITYSIASSCQAFTLGVVSTNTQLSNCSSVSYPIATNWTFGDPASGAANTSTLSSPSHTFSSTGSYTIMLVNTYQCGKDTVRIPVSAIAGPVINVAGPLTICQGENAIYTALGTDSYSWSTGALTPSISVSPTITTAYSVMATNSIGCTSLNAFTVTVNTCAGIEKQDNTFPIRFFPNPVKNELTMDCAFDVTVTIYNINGQLVFEKHFEPGINKVNTAALSEGLYTVKALGNKGVRTQRILKTD